MGVGVDVDGLVAIGTALEMRIANKAVPLFLKLPHFFAMEPNRGADVSDSFESHCWDLLLHCAGWLASWLGVGVNRCQERDLVLTLEFRIRTKGKGKSHSYCPGRCCGRCSLIRVRILGKRFH